MSWALVLDPPSNDPVRRLAGLPLALRLALDGQNGGAQAVVLSPGAESAHAALLDSRLRIPVLAALPKGLRAVRIRANTVVHRQLFKFLAEQDDQSEAPLAERDLSRDRIDHPVAWGFDPIEVCDPRTARVAERALFRALRKTQDGWTSRYLNRAISLSLTRLLVRTPLRPNQVSMAILGVGLIGAWLATWGTENGLMIGAALFQAQSILDGCDGELSRITYRGSRLGEWLDTIGDDLTNYGFFAGASLGLFRLEGNSIYLAAGATIVTAGLLTSGLEYRYLIRIGSGDLLKYPLSQSGDSGRFSLFQPLFKRDTFVLITLIAALLGGLGPLLIVFALAAIGILISVIRTEVELKRQGLP